MRDGAKASPRETMKNRVWHSVVYEESSICICRSNGHFISYESLKKIGVFLSEFGKEDFK